jgi:hypothetical protein
VGSRPVRLLLSPIAALVALLGLADCSAGVPETGSVVSVSPVTTSVPQEDASDVRDLAGPSSGLNEVEVATGYMRAMSTGDPSKIQQWVLPGVRNRVEHWDDPATTVRVYSVFEASQMLVRPDGQREVPVKVKLVGQLKGGRDWSPATGDDMLTLVLDNDGPDFRVANPDAIWMRDVNFARLYASTEVYLFPDTTRPSPQLAPVPVFVRRGDSDPDVSALEVERALEVLLDGPRGRYDHLDTAIPDGTVLRDFRYAEGVATVSLSRRFARAKGFGQLRVAQVVWTVNRLLPNTPVRIQVEGRQVRTIGDEQFSTTRAWQRRDMPLAAMLPQRSRQGQNGSVLFVRNGEIWTVTPKAGQPPKPLELDAGGTKSAPTWSPDHRAMAFLAGPGDERQLWVTPPEGGRAFPAEELSGRLSPPSWSPDSERIYVVSRDEAGARLLEVSRSTLSVRPLSLPPLPDGLQLSSVTVSPDGAFVLAVADLPDRKVWEAEPVPGGQLFLGQFGPDGVLEWSPRQLAPGLGRVFSPVWVDPVTVAFIAETGSKDDLGRLWTVQSDGWDPTAVLDDSVSIGDIGNQLTVDPAGSAFVVPARSSTGISLWMITRGEKSVSTLTVPNTNFFDVDPSFASR